MGRTATKVVVTGFAVFVLGLLSAGLHPAAASSASAPAPSPNTRLPKGWIMTPSGPLGPADRDLLTRMRLAALWQIPAGRMAGDRGETDRVREIGPVIAEQQADLDRLVRTAAAQVTVLLPNEPNADQRGWLQELANASDSRFDQLFVDRLRAAHGTLYPVIATVRAGTRNQVVRRLADQAISIVRRHLQLLESSGLVGFDRLPAPPDPQAATPAAPAGQSPGGPLIRPGSGGVPAVVVWVVLLTAAAAGVATVLRIIRPQ